MENNNKNNNTIWIVVIVVILIALGFWMYNKNAKVDNNVAQEEESTEDAGEIIDTSTGTPIAPPVVGIKYTEALAKYGDRRFQVDVACKMTPDTITYKNNTNVMLDNRSVVSHTFKIGGISTTVKAYGFKIINLASTTFPKTVLVDCDTHQNVATILIQK